MGKKNLENKDFAYFYTMKPLSLFIPASLLLFLFSCSKPANTNNTDTTAIYTDTSTNYLRCQINGNYWHNTADSVSAKWLNARRNLTITGYNYSNGHEVECISFTISSGDTIVGQPTGLDAVALGSYLCIFPQTNDSAKYFTDNTHTGTINFWFDNAGKRVGGNFSFIGGHTAGTDVSVITSGEFSMPYTTD